MAGGASEVRERDAAGEGEMGLGLGKGRGPYAPWDLAGAVLAVVIWQVAAQARPVPRARS
jgi:hypothetical protein